MGFCRLLYQRKDSENMSCLYIVIPAYNEAANIQTVIRQWYPIVERIGGESRLVVINDGSRDSTYEKVRELEESCPRLISLDQENRGHGATILRGYRYAVTHGADYVFQTDSDGQTVPEEFWPLWRDRKNCGLLIGYRKKRQDGSARVFVTRVLRMVLWFSFGVWTLDANTPFRLMRTKQLREVLDRIPGNFNLTNVLVTVIYEKFRLGVSYYPITFRPRQGGVNSINFPKIVKIGRQALKDFLHLRRKYDKELRSRKNRS